MEKHSPNQKETDTVVEQQKVTLTLCLWSLEI